MRQLRRPQLLRDGGALVQRVMIIGGPGAGKTWLGGRLAAILDLPLLRVDAIVWQADGRVRAASHIDADMLAAAARDRWIIEGGNSRTYAARVRRADLLIHLRPTRVTRLWRVLRRGGAGLELLKWTWRYDEVFGQRDADAVAMAHGRTRVIQLTSRRQIELFLATLAPAAGGGLHAHPAGPLD